MSFMAARVFNGCRALLAPATSASKSSSIAAAAAAVSKKSKTTATATEKPKAKPKPKTAASAATRTSVRPTGILKVSPVSPALAHFLGSSESSRSDAVKKIWVYIKANNLQNPSDKRQIVCDEKLKTLFDGKDSIGFLEIGKYLSHHFVKTG